MERYHAASVLSLTARHPARMKRTPAQAATERRPAHDSGLISRDYFRPPRFTSSRTCETMFGRAVFSELDAARPTTASQPPVAHDRLASFTGQGWRGRA